MEAGKQPSTRQKIGSVLVVLISLGMMLSNVESPLQYGLVGGLGALFLLWMWLSFKRGTVGKHSSSMRGVLFVGLGAAFCICMVWQFGFPKSLGEADFLVGGAIMLLAGIFMIVRDIGRKPEDLVPKEPGAPDDTSGE